MKFLNPNTIIYVPDSTEINKALARTTHLAIGAHPDDLEIMAYHGIQESFESREKFFTGIVVCDGASSPRSGKYANKTNKEMIKIRQQEQISAAILGKYNALIMLMHSSDEIKNTKKTNATSEIQAILEASQPKTVYLHNLADKHDTHVAVSLRSLSAIRRLPKGSRPKNVFGCEVWRDLDWLVDRRKAVLGVSKNPELAGQLIRVHDSQVSGGKNYHEGALGRRMANATFFDSSETDKESMVTFAMDLSPLIRAQSFKPEKYIETLLQELQQDIIKKIKKFKAKK